MAMPATPTVWTADMLDAIPDDGRRWEVIDGQLLVTPSPSDDHQFVVGELYVRFHAHVQRSTVARVVLSPSDVRRGSTTRMQPDVFVIGLQNGHRPEFPFLLSDLLIVIEVISPSSARADHHDRRRAYLGAGVPEYWIVDPDAQHVERWRAHEDRPEVMSEQIEWNPSGMDHPLVISLPELFAAASSDR